MAIARAPVGKQPIVFADESTGSLDSTNAEPVGRGHERVAVSQRLSAGSYVRRPGWSGRSDGERTFLAMLSVVRSTAWP
ncbi:MAG: hypothetical protein JWQ19_3950 [Subtercola sp.]|nr:hypothetical protein [Subtercola sp.]